MARKVNAAKIRNRAKANLISAPTLPTAPVATAPVAPRQSRQAINPSLPTPIEVGQQNKGAIGISTTPTSNLISAVIANKDGTWSVGNNRYDQATIEAIVKRGNSGGSLNQSQRAVYEKFLHNQGFKTVEETAAEVEAAKAAREDARATASNQNRLEIAKLNQQGASERAEARLLNRAAIAKAGNEARLEIAKLNQQGASERAEASRKNQAEIADKNRQQTLDIKNAEIERQNAEEEDFNSRYNIPEGTRLTKGEKDSLVNQSKVWGYSKEDQQRVDSYNRAMSELEDNPDLSLEEITAAKDELQKKIDSVKKGLVDNPKSTITSALSDVATDSETGTRWIMLNGKPFKIGDTKLDANAERERVQAEKDQTTLNKRVEGLIKQLMTRQKSGTDNEGKDIYTGGLSYSEAEQEAMRSMGVEKNGVNYTLKAPMTLEEGLKYAGQFSPVPQKKGLYRGNSYL